MSGLNGHLVMIWRPLIDCYRCLQLIGYRCISSENCRSFPLANELFPSDSSILSHLCNWLDVDVCCRVVNLWVVVDFSCRFSSSNALDLLEFVSELEKSLGGLEDEVQVRVLLRGADESTAT